MKVKKEVDVILMIIFIALFTVVGLYIGFKDKNHERVIDIDPKYVWNVEKGSIERSPERIERPEPVEHIQQEEPFIELEPVPIQPIPRSLLIIINNTKYMPTTLDISVGDTVVWKNVDQKRNYRLYHNAPNRLFNAQQLRPNNSFNYTFNEPGATNFNDAFFTYMHGTINVI